MIPFTSPMVMMARIPFGVPFWEVFLSLSLLFLTFLAVVWFAGKIYRVGILMYGKKPSLKEMWKWIKYKN
jgi:ABC-2 type transport system permease protein